MIFTAPGPSRLLLFVAACLVGTLASTASASADGGGGAGEHVRISPSLREMDAWGEHARTARIMLTLFQIAAMLAAAKLMGWAAERVKVPGVIGELLAGVILGPYLLGSLIKVPLGGGHSSWLFPAPVGGEWPVSEIVWAVAQFASIILLFVTGLHTNLEQFVKYIRPATLVAVAGLVVPFLFGALTVYIPPFAKLAQGGPTGGTLIPALFVGVMLAATSIGITARVLGDIGRLDTPEGVTILGAAVLDDVLGIVALAIVGGIASAGTISVGAVAGIAGKAFGFWIGLTLLTLALARPIEWVLTRIKYSGAMVGLGLALAFVSSGAAESFGLAFIIGAYSVGLGLSRTQMARKLMDQLEPISAFVVPIFFAALGMLVNVQAMLASWGVIAFGLVITFVAIAGKVVGCGMAARRTGFNKVGAYRIGLGMMPRGEVALIVAGIGLSRQIIGEVVFGVSIMMTLITTVLAPILLVPAFKKGGSGRKHPERPAEGLPQPSVGPGFEVTVPAGLCGLFVDRLLAVAESRGWEPSYDRADGDIYLLRSRGDAAQVTVDGNVCRVDASDPRQPEFVAMVAAVRDAIQSEAASVAVRPLATSGGGGEPKAVPAPQPAPADVDASPGKFGDGDGA